MHILPIPVVYVLQQFIMSNSVSAEMGEVGMQDGDLKCLSYFTYSLAVLFIAIKMCSVDFSLFSAKLNLTHFRSHKSIKEAYVKYVLSLVRSTFIHFTLILSYEFAVKTPHLLISGNEN